METLVVNKEKKEKKQSANPFDVGNLPGIGPVSIEKLKLFGVTSVFDLCIRGSKEIMDIAKIDEDKMEDAMVRALDIVCKTHLCRPPGLNMLELERYRTNACRIPTGSPDIDKLMMGGVETEALTEFYGENRSGKTQMCFALAVEAVQAGHDVKWIDVEDTLEPDRIAQIAIARGYAKDIEEAREKFFAHIHPVTCINVDMIVREVNTLTPFMLEKKPKLVVLDGVTGRFRAEYMGRGRLAARQQDLNLFMHKLSNISYFFSCAVVFTNQVQADPAAFKFSDPIKPIGGNVIGHVSKRRLYLQKRGSKRVCRMAKSSKHDTEEVYFSITDKGIEDQVK